MRSYMIMTFKEFERMLTNFILSGARVNVDINFSYSHTLRTLKQEGYTLFSPVVKAIAKVDVKQYKCPAILFESLCSNVTKKHEYYGTINIKEGVEINIMDIENIPLNTIKALMKKLHEEVIE